MTPTLTSPGRGRPVTESDIRVDDGGRHDRDRAAVILHNLKRSYDWQKENFYPWWEEVYQNYQMEGTRENYDDEPDGATVVDNYGRPVSGSGGKSPDPRRIRINTPDTYSTVTRRVARATAQLPVLRYRATDQELADRVGRTLMHQWDMHVQHCQERHVLQAELFGLSIRAWSYRHDRAVRKRRFRVEDLLSGKVGPEDMASVAEQYQVNPADPNAVVILQQIAAKTGGSLAITTTPTTYIGPRADFMFIGDCFFYPRFQSIQESPWFVCVRRRNRQWFDKLIEAIRNEHANDESYGNDKANRIYDQLDKNKFGSEDFFVDGGDVDDLRNKLAGLVNEDHKDNGNANQDPEAAEWVVTEIHYTGENSRVEYQLGAVWLCSLRLFELDGKIPFTELRSGTNLLHGVGDPPAKLIRSLQAAHSRSVEQRLYLADGLVRPTYYTNSRRLQNDPKMFQRKQGFNVLFLADDERIEVLGEQAAMAAVAVSSSEEGGSARLIQQTTGESNMSLAADVDPRQAQTATGSKLMARNQDILTRLMLGRVYASIREDAQMMFSLNRSEMDETYSFDGASYVGGGAQAKAPTAPITMEASPVDFQSDSIIEPEINSTLAEDDDVQVSNATNMFMMAMQAPQLLNPKTARNRLLRAHGEGSRLAEWEPEQPQGPPPAPPMEGGRISVSVTYKELPPEVQQVISQQLIASAQASGAATVPPDAVPTAEQLAMDGLKETVSAMAAEEAGAGGAMTGDRGGDPFVGG